MCCGNNGYIVIILVINMSISSSSCSASVKTRQNWWLWIFLNSKTLFDSKGLGFFFMSSDIFKTYGAFKKPLHRTDGAAFRPASERRSASQPASQWAAEYSWPYSWQHTVSAGMSQRWWGSGGLAGRWGEGRSQFDSTYLAEDSVGRRAHGRVGVRGLGLPEPPCRARGGQRLVDLRRVGRRLGFGGVQRPIKSIPPGRDRSQRFCLCVCVPASISGPAHSRWEPRLIMNCWQTSSELFSLSLFIASSCCFSLSIKKKKGCV